MSSATRTDVAKSRGIVRNMPKMDNESSYGQGAGPTDTLSARQVELDRYWRHYRCQNYDSRMYDWNGSQIAGQVETDIIANSGVIPPGFYDAGQTLPLKFRKPNAPYYLAKVIVDRFTSLLFSKKRHPRITCEDPRTENWLVGFAEATRLWAQAIQMRTYGGAQGAVAIGFKFVNGKPHVEVHDPRWCMPDFEDRSMLTVARFEKRYQFPETVRNEDGEWEEQFFWYRRLIDDACDIVWPKVKAEKGEEPKWEAERYSRVDHNFGECPIIWVQNNPVEDSIDGDSDCHGIYETIEQIDALLSQAARGTIANCDPTLGVASDCEFDQITKGSGSAVQVGKGESIEYLEMTGTGIERAEKLADRLENNALTVARCVLERNTDAGSMRTATEVQKNYSSMIEAADIYREQYGERGIKLLLEMVLRVARKMGVPRTEMGEDDIPSIVVSTIRLPKSRVKGSPDEAPQFEERVLGESEDITLKWPDYFEPTLDDVVKAVSAAGQARSVYNILDTRSAVEFIAPYLGLEDLEVILARIEEQEKLTAPGGDMSNLVQGLTAPKFG